MGTVGLSRTEKGQATDATGIQIAGVLDDLFAYDGPLGANVIKDGVKFDVWAPTAQVTFKIVLFRILVFSKNHETTCCMDTSEVVNTNLVFGSPL